MIVVLLAASSASAATLNVSGGQLLGASGVIVDGSSYDVAFLDGTCIALYNGCDDVSDFTFQTSAAAVLASQALLDQVFLDGGSGAFDSVPQDTAGCSDLNGCGAFTPYNFTSPNFYYAGAYNDAFEGNDHTAYNNVYPSLDTTTIPSAVYAVWTPVPEPGTAVMICLGLLGLSVRKRRHV